MFYAVGGGDSGGDGVCQLKSLLNRFGISHFSVSLAITTYNVFNESNIKRIWNALPEKPLRIFAYSRLKVKYMCTLKISTFQQMFAIYLILAHTECDSYI